MMGFVCFMFHVCKSHYNVTFVSEPFHKKICFNVSELVIKTQLRGAHWPNG